MTRVASVLSLNEVPTFRINMIEEVWRILQREKFVDGSLATWVAAIVVDNHEAARDYMIK